MFNRCFSFFLFLLLLSVTTLAQDTSVVKWNVSTTEKIDNLHYKVTLQGAIAPGWHIYKGDATADLNEPALQTLAGDTLFQIDALRFLSTNEVSIDDPLFGKKLIVYKDSVRLLFQLSFTRTPSAIQTKLSYFIAKDDFLNQEEPLIPIAFSAPPADVQTPLRHMVLPSIDLNNPVRDCGASPKLEKQSLWGIFFVGFLAGLLALLTPCVFPMIPLTVSFFTKKSSSQRDGIFRASMYGFFIFIIYILLSLPFHFLDSVNPELLNNISTNVYLNVAFFVIFIFFALSFFGLFEITLPAWATTGADSKSGLGTISGIFFMALTLAIVSFSCTGPILGSLLAGSLASNGGAWQLTVGMGGFGLALALPFTILAFFPQLLQSLPKSGSWLNTVKIVLGFLEVGLAFKFLSNADMVSHWNLLKREIFIGIWILVGLGLSAFLFGLLRFKHDPVPEKLSFFRKGLAIITLVFTLYLVPGLTSTSWANLKLISGFPPPLYYSIYKPDSDCILDLNCAHDYETGLNMARAQKKPMLIDFTGYACVNCRRMEENVWSDEEIHTIMKENFIVVSLYVDDKKKLPAALQTIHRAKDGSIRKIVTYGDLWATFESENFNNNAQPLYVLMDDNEKLLTHPVGYTPNKNEYADWLRCGLAAFQQGNPPLSPNK
jgi:thiol:disulfide interchange protein DsbD